MQIVIPSVARNLGRIVNMAEILRFALDDSIHFSTVSL